MNRPAVSVQSPSPQRRYAVPFVNAREHYRRLKSEIDAAILDCLENGDLIHRRQLFDFEKNLAAYVGTKYAVGVNSGYHALHFSLLAAGIGPGDEVITVAHTFAASISAIVHCGATPVLVDVAEDFNMDIACLRKAVTPRTRAIMPVHLNGRLCDMEPILELAHDRELAIIEDACQAMGARYQGRMAGSFGSGCFSFYPFKALGGFGDGGAVTTDECDVARFVTLMRYNGEDRETGEFFYHGQTALLDNVQAAVLDVKLRHLPAWLEHRQHIAELYRRGLEGTSNLRLPHFPDHRFEDSFQNYVIRAERRDALQAHLADNGVETLVSWPQPIWSHAGLKLGCPDLPFTERLCREVLSLPMSAETTPEQVSQTVCAIRQFYTG
jgi:dTDP-4-amino-4,6-dideoxygalactose transaminase